MKPGKTSKPTDQEQVASFMAQLQHPLKPEMEALREIIKGADPRIGERVKWNAPSYYFQEDLVTFNPRAVEHVHLVFHHPRIEMIASNLLEGNYRGRRMTYFRTLEEVNTHQHELQRIIRELISHIDGD